MKKNQFDWFVNLFFQARFDFEVFELGSDGSGGTCVYDSVGILNSPDGPGGRICGSKSGYGTITRLPKDTDLKLSVIVQGPSYRWDRTLGCRAGLRFKQWITLQCSSTYLAGNCNARSRLNTFLKPSYIGGISRLLKSDVIKLNPCQNLQIVAGVMPMA